MESLTLTNSGENSIEIVEYFQNYAGTYDIIALGSVLNFPSLVASSK